MQTRDSIRDIWGPSGPPIRARDGGRSGWTSGRSETPERWVQSCCVLCSNGCGMDIGVKDGRIVGVRGRGWTASTAGGSGPRGCTAGRRTTAPTGSRGRWSAAGQAPGGELGRGDGPGRREGQAGPRPTPPARSGSTTPGQLFIEEYYTLGGDRQGRARHDPHGRQHAALHRDRGAGPSSRRSAPTASPARTPISTSPMPSSWSGTTSPSSRPSLWMRILDRLRRPEPAEARRHRPAARPRRRGGRRPPGTRVGTNVAVMNGLMNLIIEAGPDRPGIHRRATRSASTSFGRWSPPYPPERVEQITGIPAASSAGPPT